MPNTLNIALRLIPHPYPHMPGAAEEVWGGVIFSWQSDAELISLLATQWDLLPLAEWFVENQASLRHETWAPNHVAWEPPHDGSWDPQPEESLAQALQRSQARLFSDDEKDAEECWQEKVFAFRRTHSLRFALRGANVPAILIGCNHGKGEISEAGDTPWSYPFAMEDFCRELALALRHVLKEWLERTRPEPAHKRAEKALARLAETSAGSISERSFIS